MNNTSLNRLLAGLAIAGAVLTPSLASAQDAALRVNLKRATGAEATMTGQVSYDNPADGVLWAEAYASGGVRLELNLNGASSPLALAPQATLDTPAPGHFALIESIAAATRFEASPAGGLYQVTASGLDAEGRVLWGPVTIAVPATAQGEDAQPVRFRATAANGSRSAVYLGELTLEAKGEDRGRFALRVAPPMTQEAAASPVTQVSLRVDAALEGPRPRVLIDDLFSRRTLLRSPVFTGGTGDASAALDSAELVVGTLDAKLVQLGPDGDPAVVASGAAQLNNRGTTAKLRFVYGREGDRIRRARVSVSASDPGSLGELRLSVADPGAPGGLTVLAASPDSTHLDASVSLAFHEGVTVIQAKVGFEPKPDPRFPAGRSVSAPAPESCAVELVDGASCETAAGGVVSLKLNPKTGAAKVTYGHDWTSRPFRVASISLINGEGRLLNEGATAPEATVFEGSIELEGVTSPASNDERATRRYMLEAFDLDGSFAGVTGGTYYQVPGSQTLLPDPLGPIRFDPCSWWESITVGCSFWP